MSRPAQRRAAAAIKRQPMDHFPDAGKMIDDDTDESEWDDVSGHDLGADDEDVQEDQQ